MSAKLNSAIAVVGIDIGKNSFHVSIGVARSSYARSGLAANWNRGLRTFRLASLVWKPVLARII
jgi:hypothetical protein